ncbi:MAG: prephenate dehydrogenase/arogenate dehydrogenase family protein, partial [Acidimicrobiia bacterium]
GGSLGLACRKRNLGGEVVGFDLRRDRLERALERGAITRIADSAEDAVAEADVVVIATPVGSIPKVFAEIASMIKGNACVTDVGSTKARVVSEIAGLPAHERFVGGHPIAGAEEEGIEAATDDLFEGCVWILTPTEDSDPASYTKLVRFVGQIGARVLSLDPSRHDQLVALTSHLPQLISSTLMRFAAEIAAAEGGLPLVAAGGFRDMTRIAASSPNLWVEILKDNTPAVLEVLERFETALAEVHGHLEAARWQEIAVALENARSARRALPGKPGVAPVELVELLIPVPDRPGVLSEITTTVGEAGINIEDIDIVHSPEGGRGTIHLAISGKENSRLAAEAVERKGYRVTSAE